MTAKAVEGRAEDAGTRTRVVVLKEDRERAGAVVEARAPEEPGRNATLHSLDDSVRLLAVRRPGDSPPVGIFVGDELPQRSGA